MQATNNTGQNFAQSKNHFSIHSNEAWYFLKKSSHGYIIVLKMWYFNQGQVIKTSNGNSHFEVTTSKSIITYVCVLVDIVTDFWSCDKLNLNLVLKKFI